MRKNNETKTTVSEYTKFNLEQAFVLWKNESKKGNTYLKGFDLNNTGVIAYFNTNKKNPKEPDVRVYRIDEKGEQGEEVATLWSNVGKDSGKKYLSGMTNEKEKLVGFFGDESEEKRPYIRAYFQENE